MLRAFGMEKSDAGLGFFRLTHMSIDWGPLAEHLFRYQLYGEIYMQL